MGASKTDWLSASTGAGKAEIVADLIIAGEVTPPNPEKPWVLPPVGSGMVFKDGFDKHMAAKAKKLKTKDDLRGARRSLYQLVEDELAQNPVNAEGRLWANLPAAKVSELLGVSRDHARGLHKSNPFRYAVKIIDGRKTTLIRIAHPADLTSEDQAKMMTAFWRKAVNRRESKSEFGMLKGIADDCPMGRSYDIFRTTVANWSSFMACVKIAQYLGQYEGDEYDQNPENFYSRFLVYPSISTIRRFVHVARDFYSISLQGV